MSSNPAEPEKYSLDDMMDRLQSKSGPTAEDSGELVTRADGSQAIKVRKRKRRSTQPHKEEAKRTAKLRVIQVSSLVIFAILLVLTFGGLIIYANSGPFRQGVINKISAVTGAKIKFHQFRVNPASSNVVLADFQWPGGNLIKSLSLSEVSTKALIAGIISKDIGVDEISVTNANIRIGSPIPGEETRFSPKQGPSAVSFDRLGVNKVNATFGDAASPSLQLLGSEASLYPENINGHPTVRLFKGEVKIPLWPAYRLDRALMEFHDSKVEVVSLKLLHELDPDGTIELTGSFEPSDTGKIQSLGVKVDSFSMNGIVGPALGNLIKGRISTGSETPETNQLTFAPGQDSSSKVVLSFKAADNSAMQFNGFSFLSVLSHLFENRALLEPIFDDQAAGTLTRENGVVTLSNLSFSAKKQLRITGDLTLAANDALSGELQVAIPEASVIASGNTQLKEVFKNARDGYRWISVKISGTGSHPADNFAEIYEGTAKAAGSTNPANSFEELTAPK